MQHETRKYVFSLATTDFLTVYSAQSAVSVKTNTLQVCECVCVLPQLPPVAVVLFILASPRLTGCLTPAQGVWGGGKVCAASFGFAIKSSCAVARSALTCAAQKLP